MVIKEPVWKSFVAKTTRSPVLTPEECKTMIEIGRSQPKHEAKVFGSEKPEVSPDKRISHISWIPFIDKARPMYQKIEAVMHTINSNHFGFENMQITEQAQYTEYPVGGHYDWHIDASTHMQDAPPVRKISMTLILSEDHEYEGGDVQLLEREKGERVAYGHAIFFASFIRHKVAPITKGVRKSLVMWFGGTPFK